MPERMRIVRYLNLLSLLSGIGLGVVFAAAPGCAPECAEDDYTECTSQPGLRYTLCGGSNYEFNDGAHFDDLGFASDYCYCGINQLECKDGRLASLCNVGPLDGSSALVYDDGSRRTLEKGTAACLGFDTCTLETSSCSFNGWYLYCSTGSTVRYVSSTTEIFRELGDAVIACNPPVVDGEAGPGRCADAIATCVELPDCDASAACKDDTFFCSSVVACDKNDDMASCAADPACKWELN